MHELELITDAFKAREIDIVKVAELLRPLNLLMIGTAISEPVHCTQSSLLTYNTSLGVWQDTCKEQQRPRLLRATGLGRVALLCALFGDMNQPGQRSKMGDSFTSQPSPHYGFALHPNFPEGITIHALPEVISEVQRRGTTLTGAIDIVDGTPFMPMGSSWGHFMSATPVFTISTLAITGKDLPSDISSINYTKFDAPTSQP